MPKTLRKTARKSTHENCYKTTMHGLHEWYETEFEKLGWMILAKHHGLNDKIQSYKTTLQHLKQALETKLRLLHDYDKKADVKIMWENVGLLIEHVNKDFR